MKIFRVLTNSLLSGIFFSLLIALLVANININLKPNGLLYLQLVAFISLVYGLIASLLFFILFFLIEFLFGRSFKIKFISPSFICLSFSFSFLMFLALLRLNFNFYRSFFSSSMMDSIKIQTIVSVTIPLAGSALFWRYHRHRKKPFYFVFYFLVLFVGLAIMFWSRANFPQSPSFRRQTVLITFPSPRKATLLNFEGLSFNFLIPLINEGKLPNFSWLMENGCWGRLETLSPTDPFVLQKSLLTGKNPHGHRCLSAEGFTFWGKNPVLEALPRFMLFKQLSRLKILNKQPIPCQPNKDLWQILREMNLKLSVFGSEDKGEAEFPLSSKAEKMLDTLLPVSSASDERLLFVRQALRRDISLEERAFAEKSQQQPQVLVLSLEGLNQVEIFFYKYSFPLLFGNIDQNEISRYGPIIEKYYQFYDQLIGKYLAHLKENETLIVFSTHGMEPLPLWKRLVEWALGNPQVSGHFEFAPPGVIFFYGQDILKGQSLEKIRLVDITPTLLYWLGLPVARDMDGLVCSSVFKTEFSQENPVFYISSYEEFSIKPGVK